MNAIPGFPKGPFGDIFDSDRKQSMLSEPEIRKVPGRPIMVPGGVTHVHSEPHHLTIGIDPGLSGAIAFISDDGLPCVYDLPVMRDKSLAWIDGAALQSLIINEREGRNATARIERVSAMPGQGVSSSFQFGVGFGSILGVLQALSIPIEFVTPGVWKKFYGLDSDKKAALYKARLLYPDVDLHLAKHDGRAEALLIARYARSVTKVAA